MKNLHKVSCLSVFHLAETADNAQIQSLNDEERKMIMDIANSIISGGDLPSIENREATMEGIVDKLTHMRPQKTSWYENVGNFVKQHIHGTMPSSNDIVHKLIEVKNTIKVNKGRLPGIHIKLEKKSLEQQSLKEQISGIRSCLSMYEALPQYYQKLKNKNASSSLKNDELMETLKQMETRLEEAKKELTEESSVMKGRLAADIKYISHVIHEIETPTMDSLKLTTLLKKVCDHFSERLTEEKKEFEILEDEKKFLDADRKDLEKTREQLDKTVQYGKDAFTQILDREKKQLKHEIDQLQSVVNDHQEKKEKNMTDPMTDLHHKKLVDLKKNYSRLETISNFFNQKKDELDIGQNVPFTEEIQ